MKSIFNYIFNTSSILIMGGLITAISALFSGLNKKKKVLNWIKWGTFIGGIIGGYKADLDSEKYKQKLLEKTNTIAQQATQIAEITEEHSQKILKSITGVDSFCYLCFGF
jgi:hypothetical protein